AWLFAWILVSSLVVIAGVWIKQPAILDSFRRPIIPSMFGPLDADRAFRAIVHGLAQAAVVSSLGLVLVGQVPRRPQWASAVALMVMTADLAAANARYVLTVAPAVLDSQPEALRIIEDHEHKEPQAGPFRIHRMPAWHPPGWQTTPSVHRD